MVKKRCTCDGELIMKIKMLRNTLRLFRCVVIVTRIVAPERQLPLARNTAAPTDARGAAEAIYRNVKKKFPILDFKTP